MGYGIKSHLRGHRLYSYLRGRDDYAAALDANKPLLRYIGWLGHNNVGDEALYAAFKSPLFPNCLVTPFYDLSALSLLSSFKPHKLVVLGGGTLINDVSYLEPLERSQRRGSRTFVFGTGVGDLDYWAKHPGASERGHSARWLAALAKADYVGVRGPRSLKWLHDNGIEKAEILGDPALCLTRPRPAATTDDRVLGVNLGSHDPPEGGIDRPYEALKTLVRHALDEGQQVRFISLHDIDAEIGAKMVAEVNHPRFACAPFDGDVNRALDQIGACHLAVGQRLHFTVLACALGVPNLSLSYQPKCLDFLESIARADLAVATDQVTPQLLVERFEWLRQQAVPLAAHIDAACDELRAFQRRRATEVVARLTA
ncbi:polysaccharide pyruvyl transferase family protein [Piscinibacter gummiphilus]|uniref:Uncharacterized protein n=1 Tax=Piscinibacter gummiphilus TaxID=946333 RepID=A0A1W6LEB7_9BURK|nr:polysaccharide pyruvyl transferase family protein [Piscinibacter gummiphilus]ARN22573.1 hypothetical protein A4W93_23160 [Piscinibacter gummiphilus]ATU67272.1 hypothetical protein CPZ87_23290 [Piscinibacter gummiphilus]GLS97611.1 polysaccharide pyruvyl transferase [Piscinibacter gummiphilus]